MATCGQLWLSGNKKITLADNLWKQDSDNLEKRVQKWPTLCTKMYVVLHALYRNAADILI